MRLTQQQLEAHLWGAANILRGKTAGQDYKKGGLMRVEQSLLAESWNPQYAALGFDHDEPNPAFLKPSIEELSKSDG